MMLGKKIFDDLSDFYKCRNGFEWDESCGSC